ncbi:MinD/ParA family ATP-binding protein [Sphaerisporangium perillae]|uniref:MinD/ParA family ATP-binding protein n=1 Tax=Sphaerisporangium perillae TaxID=2935860 RepID=UPI002010C5E7|nr:MinD/ParA family protein [Sphaerisporangium perillae]
MARVITMHSYRGGTGKSSTAANMGLLLAAEGLRVGILDTDIQSPAVDTIFGVPPGAATCTFADYLVGRCEIEEAVRPVPGQDLFIVPSRTGLSAINEIMADGYDVGLLNEAVTRLVAAFRPDVLLLDTHTGINTETVMAVAGSDALVIVTRAHRLDLAGAAESVALADRLGCGQRAVVVNMVPEGTPDADLVPRVEKAYGSPVTAVLPYVPEMAELAGEHVFVTAHPRHALVAGYREINSVVLGDAG